MSHLARHRPPDQGCGHGDDGAPPAATASSEGTEGVIDFGWGRCALRATAGALTPHAEVGDPRHLQRIQDGVSARLQRIGRRDQLAVAWAQFPSVTGPQPETGQ